MHSQNIRRAAKKLYLTGLCIDDIARKLKISVKTLYKWRCKFAWQDELKLTKEEVIFIRINKLAEKGINTSEETKKFIRLIDAFGNLQIKHATAQRIRAERAVLRETF